MRSTVFKKFSIFSPKIFGGNEKVFNFALPIERKFIEIMKDKQHVSGASRERAV